MYSDLPLLKDRIIRSLDIVQLYEDAVSAMLGSSVKFSSADGNGWHKKVRCPFHDDAHPSFAVNSVSGGFRCFAGGCNRQGSIFDFWIDYKGYKREIDFIKALQELADLGRIDVKDWQKSKEYKQASEHAKEHSQVKLKSELKPINKADAQDEAHLAVDQKIVDEFCENLGPQDYQYLCTIRGLTLETIKKYKIGWNPGSRVKTPEGSWVNGRYTIPVYNKAGECRNIRHYSPQATSAYKMLNYKPDKARPGFGSPPRIFGAYALLHRKINSVCLCEGELDTILLNQKFEQGGLTDWLAITNTHGAGTFEPEWLDLLYDKAVYFIYDCDEPGKRESASHCSNYFLGPLKAGRFTVVKNVLLPMDGSKEYKDITDYFMKLNRGLDELLVIIQSTPGLESGGSSGDEATVAPVEIGDLSEAIQNRNYIDKRIRTPLTIVGTTSIRYHAVRSYRVTRCQLASEGGSTDEGECCNDFKEKLIPYGHPMFIHSGAMTAVSLEKKLKAIACIKGQRCGIEIIKKVVMEQYLAQQTVKRFLARENTEGKMENMHHLTDVNVYFLQPERHINVEPRDYLATGWIRSHPQTNITSLFIEELEPLENDWENFQITDEIKEQLKIFSGMSFYEILSDISNHVTHIYNSPRILAAVLLAYCSPIWITFNNSITRGWINACIIGDSGVGKSSTYMRIADYIDVGDLFSMLTGSRTGLLYSIQNRLGEWKLQIGRYVSADRKIIAIDEAQEAEKEDIKSMAISMDKGELDISKVQKATYSTRTRLVLLLNPPEGKTLSDFPHGCMALAECFDPMFIRRLDIAVLVPSQQDNAFYNKSLDEFSEKGKISADALRYLVFWAWTRKSANIQWEPAATKCCLEKATELANDYGDAVDVPLLNPSDCRLTLARLCTSHAILTGQFSDDFENCIVKVNDVIEVVALLRNIYSDTACNLGYYSSFSRHKNQLNDSEYSKIKSAFEKLIRGVSVTNESKQTRYYAQPEKLFCQLILLLQSGNEIKSIDIRDYLCASAKWIKYHISVLASYKMLEVAKFGYRTTPKFNRFMGRWINEDFIDYDSSGMPQTIKVQDMMASINVRLGEKLVDAATSKEFKEQVTNDEYYESQHQKDNYVEAGSTNDPTDDPFYAEFGDFKE